MSERFVRRCGRCNGCGQVAGSGHRESPWNTFENLPVHHALEKIMGMQRPRPCPDCGGTGQVHDTAA